MKILVLGAMHGNELLGPAVVDLFKDKPVEGVDVAIANEPAFKEGVRATGEDLNRSFPGGAGGTYEQRRAAELLVLCKRYDLVLDFHNTYTPNNDCGFLGETAKPEMYRVAWILGLTNVVVADYDCINKYAPNCLSIEISIRGLQDSPAAWYERISQLSRLKSFATDEKVERYRFVYRVTLEDMDRLDLPSRNLQPFKPMPKGVAAALGLKGPAYPLFPGLGVTPQNYGGVLYKIKC